MNDLEFNTKNIISVLPQAIAAGAASSDGRTIETKGARILKIRILATGVAAGKAVSYALTGGATYATRGDNAITTKAPTADANGNIDATYYVKTPTTIYGFITGELTVAADAGASVVASVDIEAAQLRGSTNLSDSVELYS